MHPKTYCFFAKLPDPLIIRQIPRSFVLPPTHAETAPSLTGASRDATSLIVTQCLGLPPLSSHPALPLSVHYALKLSYHAHKSAPFILCSQHTRRPVLIASSRILILLLLCSSGDVEVNPGLVCPHALSFVDFCNSKCLGFLHVNIRSLLPKCVLFTVLAHYANPDVPAESESWLRKATKNLKFQSPITIFSIKIELLKGAELQSTVERACRVLSYYPDLQIELLLLKIHLSRNKSITVAACYRPPSAPSCALDTIGELIGPHLSSEFVLLGGLNWDMLNTPAVLNSKLAALNLKSSRIPPGTTLNP